MNPKVRFFPFLLIPILFLYFWIGARNLNADALWYDEWFSIFYADGDPRYEGFSLEHIWERVAADRESMPPGYYWLLHGWGRIYGYDAVAMRTFSLFCGALGIAAIYRLGRSLYSRTAGLASAAAYGLSAYVIFHASEVRNYTLYPLIVILLLWTYWRVAFSPHPPKLRHAVGLAACMAALAYTHYMGVTVLLALGAYHLIFVPKHRRWLIPAACALIAGLTVVPWALKALDAAAAVGESQARLAFADDAITLLGKLLHTFSNGAVVWIAAFGWFALEAIRRKRRERHKRDAWFVVWMTAVTIGLGIAANEAFQFIIGSRYLMGAFPLLALTVGVGADEMARRKMRPAVWIALFMAGGVFITFDYPLAQSMNNTTAALRLRWDRLAPTLAAYPTASDRLIALLPDENPYWFYAPLIEYYLPVHAEPNLPWMRPLRVVDGTRPPLDAHLIESLPMTPPSAYTGRFMHALDGADSLWMTLSPASPPSPMVRRAWESAARDFMPCQLNNPALDRRNDFDLSMQFFARMNGELRGHVEQVSFGEQAELRVSLSRDAYSGRMAAVLRWNHTLPPYMYSVALQWQDAAGNMIAQSDAGLPPELRSCLLFALHASEGAIPFSRLHVVLYDWQTGARLNGVGVDGVEAARPLLAAFPG